MKKGRKALLAITVMAAVLAGIEIYPLAVMRTPGMTESIIEGFRVHYLPGDEAGARAVALAVGRARARLADRFGGLGGRPVSIYVYHSRADLHARRYGTVGRFPALDWWIGDNTRNAVLIINPVGPPGHDTIVTAAVHEYVHVMTDRMYPRTRKWLKEGLACYLAGQGPNGHLVLRAGLPSFDLLTMNDPIKFAGSGGYQFSYTYVEFLADRYGWDAIRSLLLSQEDYQAVLKKDRREVYREWLGVLSAKYR